MFTRIYKLTLVAVVLTFTFSIVNQTRACDRPNWNSWNKPAHYKSGAYSASPKYPATYKYRTAPSTHWSAPKPASSWKTPSHYRPTASKYSSHSYAPVSRSYGGYYR